MENLKAAMGENATGDNQFTNKAKPPDLRARAFHIEQLELRDLKGKTILAVEGYFTDPPTGQPQTYYKGAFAELPTQHGTEVHQLFLQSQNKVAFTASRLYSTALSTRRSGESKLSVHSMGADGELGKSLHRNK